jgi:hypothetical protein
MSINPSTYAITVEDSPTLLIEDTSSAQGVREDGRCTYEVYNNGASTVYLGDAEVDDTVGIPLPAGSSRTIAIRFKAVLYGATSAGETAEVRVLRVP